MHLYRPFLVHYSLTGGLCFSWWICITIWSHQLPSWKPPFRISCKVNLLAIKFLQVLRLELAPHSDSNSYFFCRELQSSPCLWIASLSEQKSLSHCSVPLGRGGSHWSFLLASPSLETPLQVGQSEGDQARVRVISAYHVWARAFTLHTNQEFSLSHSVLERMRNTVACSSPDLISPCNRRAEGATPCWPYPPGAGLLSHWKVEKSCQIHVPSYLHNFWKFLI